MTPQERAMKDIIDVFKKELQDQQNQIRQQKEEIIELRKAINELSPIVYELNMGE